MPTANPTAVLPGIHESDRLATLLAEATGGAARVHLSGPTLASLWLRLPGRDADSAVLVVHDRLGTAGIVEGVGECTALGLGPDDPASLGVLRSLLALTGGYLSVDGDETAWEEVPHASQASAAD